MVLMAMVRVNGHEIAYLESSGTGRPVVFVHGNSFSSRIWAPLLEGPFGDRYRCLALDLPGHGESPASSDPDTYSLPGYAVILAGFVAALDVHDAVIVGWSLGGHIALEAVPALADPAGLVIFGAPPIASADTLPAAFLPNPAANIAFTAELSEQDARVFAETCVAPDASIPLQPLIADILATTGQARARLGASLAGSQFTDEVAITKNLRIPLAILHGREDHILNLDYLNGLSIPTLWRDTIQVIDRVGHTPQQEAPEKLTELLEQFITGLPAGNTNDKSARPGGARR
jgi:pimeloyl-ACP methyl ester carboxylesterase